MLCFFILKNKKKYFQKGYQISLNFLLFYGHDKVGII